MKCKIKYTLLIILCMGVFEKGVSQCENKQNGKSRTWRLGLYAI